MKIQNERLEGLLPQEQSRKTSADRKVFEELLSQQLGQSQQTAQSTTGTQNLDALLLMNATAPEPSTTGSPEDALLAGLFDQTEEALGDWENYAKNLGEGQNKAAWNMLTSLDARIKTVRGGLGEPGSLGARGEGLDAVLNELEVLTATEKFKFNRGDYQ